MLCILIPSCNRALDLQSVSCSLCPPVLRDTAASSQHCCSLSVPRRMSARAGTAAACRAYRAKNPGISELNPGISSLIMSPSASIRTASGLNISSIEQIQQSLRSHIYNPNFVQMPQILKTRQPARARGCKPTGSRIYKIQK